MVTNTYNAVSRDTAEQSVRALLRYIGENPNRDGLLDTPRRVARAWSEMTVGYGEDVAALLARQFDQEDMPYGGIVALRKVPFASLCEHHLLPFVGEADVAYIPGYGRIVGLSKLARLVDAYARRLQVQERMTIQIVEALEEHLTPKASACIIRADHTCMTIRGVQKTSGGMVTSELRGAFKDDARARAELLHLLG
jgi:GTP cyclohydrolase IA